MQRHWTRAIAGGLIGTLVMSAVGVWLAPLMGLPKMNPADMLAGAMRGSTLLGWTGHLMIGVIQARHSLPGTNWLHARNARKNDSCTRSSASA